MRGAIEEDLGVQGAIIVEVAVVDSSGVNKASKQMVYVCRRIRLYSGLDDRRVSLWPCLWPGCGLSWVQQLSKLILDFALLYGPELYQGYIKLACELIMTHFQSNYRAVGVIRSRDIYFTEISQLGRENLDLLDLGHPWVMVLS